jgi:hypothetical protein
MNKSNLLCTKMDARSFDVRKDLIMSHDNEKQLVLKLIQLRMLIYFAIVIHTCSGILFLSISQH